MKAVKTKGLTGVEIMVSVAVLAVLVAAVIGITTRINTSANIELAKSTITLIGTALEQYYDHWDDYPPDCNDIDNAGDLLTILKADSLGVWTKQLPADAKGSPPAELEDYTGIGIAYYCLSRMGTSKQVISKLSESVVSTLTADKLKMGIDVDGKDYPFFYVLDPWKMPLRYSRTWVDPTNGTMTYRQKGFTKDFPKVESAGPDKVFDTDDDITSREN